MPIDDAGSSPAGANLYAATVCVRAGRYQIYEQLVVICRMSRTLSRWTREARVKLENWGERAAVHPANPAEERKA